MNNPFGISMNSEEDIRIFAVLLSVFSGVLAQRPGAPRSLVFGCSPGRLELTSFRIVPVPIIHSRNFGVLVAILLAGAIATATTPALAQMRVRGSPEAVRIEARNTSVGEVLSALSSAFNMHYQSSVNLDKRVSGIYAGPLRSVLARILAGYNFVLKTDSGSIAVTVYAPPNTGAAPAVGVQPAEGGTVNAASASMPVPTVQGREGPPFPTPARPSSGAAPAPIPEIRGAEAAVPAPPVLGSNAIPAPQPGTPAGTPSSPAAPISPPAK
jgi:hypothetical protein